MEKKELAKRYTLFIISLFIAAFGVAITKRGDLGVSPISSVANVMSERFLFLSMGNWLIIWNCVLIIGQVVLLRKDFKLIQLLQVPISFLFGWFTDFGLWCMKNVPNDVYVVRIILVICGVVVLGFGVSLSFIANVLMNSGEAFVKAISDKTSLNIGNVKIGFDVFCVILSVVLSLVFFKGSIVGTREGTIITAILTGTVVKFFTKILKEPLEKMLKK